MCDVGRILLLKGGLCCICLWVVRRGDMIISQPRVIGGGTWVGLQGHVLHDGVCISVCFDLLSQLEHGLLHRDNVNRARGLLGNPLQHLDVGLKLFKGMGVLAGGILASRGWHERGNIVCGILDLCRGESGANPSFWVAAVTVSK